MLQSISADGLADRYIRAAKPRPVVIDVLAPEGLGERADLTTTPPGRTIEVPGGTQALSRTEQIIVVHEGRSGTIPRPTLLAATVGKAAATALPRPDRHRRDLALPCALVGDPFEVVDQMTRKDRRRPRLTSRLLGDPPSLGTGALRDQECRSDRVRRPARLSRRYRDDVPEDFVIARNAEPGSTLPYLLRVPLGDGIILKVKDSWPRTGKVYCHRVEEWPTDAEIIERVPVRSCVRRGAAIDLVLDRGRENRSQIVVTNARGRQMIFWQTARTAKQARPAVNLPGARASGVADLEIVVDIRERYRFTFADRQATTRRATLSAGDYGLVVDGLLQASVERKSLADLVSSLTTGTLKFQLTELSAIPRAAVVVEERYSQVFKLDHVRPSVVADAIAECQIRFPTVPIVFCDTRKLAQEWTYRFLAAARVGLSEEMVGDVAVRGLEAAPPLAPAPPTPAAVRRWATTNNIAVADRGRIPAAVMDRYLGARARGDT
ncbi:MAG: histone-like nucleoid-structuring protein Lsr2 [Nocardioidaceae bacterium]